MNGRLFEYRALLPQCPYNTNQRQCLTPSLPHSPIWFTSRIIFTERLGFNCEDALATAHFYKIQLFRKQKVLQKRLPGVSLLSERHYHYYNCYHYHHLYDHYGDNDQYSYYHD